MTWVRVDDAAPEHPKIAQCGPLGFALWIAGLAYCNRNLTDGFIPTGVASRLLSWTHPDSEGNHLKLAATWDGEYMGGGWDIDAEEVIAILIRVDLWEEVPGGYRVHDYLDYQPSKQDILALKEKRAAAGRIGGLHTQANAKASALATPQANGQAKSKPSPRPNPAPSQPIEGQTDHQIIARKGISAEVRDSMQRLADTLPDMDKGTIGRLVNYAKRGAAAADFEDARAAIKECPAERPSAYACTVIHNRLKERGL